MESTIVDAYTSPEELALLRQRYLTRHDLAVFYHVPEGYEFIHTPADGQHYSVILIIPPGLIAVQHANGTWTRRSQSKQGGPASITEDWYIKVYLADIHLPAWFMRPAHAESVREAYQGEMRRLQGSRLQPHHSRGEESCSSTTPDFCAA